MQNYQIKKGSIVRIAETKETNQPWCSHIDSHVSRLRCDWRTSRNTHPHWQYLCQFNFRFLANVNTLRTGSEEDKKTRIPFSHIKPNEYSCGDVHRTVCRSSPVHHFYPLQNYWVSALPVRRFLRVVVLFVCLFVFCFVLFFPDESS